jgi:hypothetical protein
MRQLQQHLHLHLLQRLPQLHRRLYGLVHRVQRLFGLQRMLGQLLQLQGRAVVRVVPWVQRLRGLRRLRGMQRQLPKRMLWLYILQHQLQRRLQRELFRSLQEFLLERLFELIPHWRLTCLYPLENRGCST